MEQNILVDVLTSLQRLFLGYFSAALVGVFIGILIGLNGIVYQILKRILHLGRSVIPIALLPLVLIVFKQIELAAFVVVFMSAVWTIIIDTAKGIRQFRQHGNNFRVAMNHIFEALKIGIWIAWFTVIAMEMLTGGRGLGVILWGAYQSGNSDNIIQVTIYISIIGFLLDQLLDITGHFLSQIVLEGQQKNL